jgi:hypothetical protein
MALFLFRRGVHSSSGILNTADGVDHLFPRAPHFGYEAGLGVVDGGAGAAGGSDSAVGGVAD